MRITWMCVSEQIVLMSDGRPYAMGILAGNIPWFPPQIQIPVSVLFVMEFAPDDDRPRKLTIRIVSPDGKQVGNAETTQGPNPTPGKVSRTIVMIGGQAAIPAPGDYEVQLLLDGQPMDDTPTWTLRFRDVRPRMRELSADGGPTPQNPASPSGDTTEGPRHPGP